MKKILFIAVIALLPLTSAFSYQDELGGRMENYNIEEIEGEFVEDSSEDLKNQDEQDYVEENEVYED